LVLVIARSVYLVYWFFVRQYWWKR